MARRAGQRDLTRHRQPLRPSSRHANADGIPARPARDPATADAGTHPPAIGTRNGPLASHHEMQLIRSLLEWVRCHNHAKRVAGDGAQMRTMGLGRRRGRVRGGDHLITGAVPGWPGHRARERPDQELIT